MQIFKTPNHFFSVTSEGCRFLAGVYGTLYLYPLLLITRYLSCWKNRQKIAFKLWKRRITLSSRVFLENIIGHQVKNYQINSFIFLWNLSSIVMPSKTAVSVDWIVNKLPWFYCSCSSFVLLSRQGLPQGCSFFKSREIFLPGRPLTLNVRFHFSWSASNGGSIAIHFTKYISTVYAYF